MKRLSQLMSKMKDKRSGFSLVELLIAVVVLGILSAMLLAAGTASQNKARISVATNDLDGIKNSVYQCLMAHPNVAKWRDDDGSTGSGANITAEMTQLIAWLNNELDDAWAMAPVGSSGGTTTLGSGLIAQTTITKDPWDNPYGLYVYTNSQCNGGQYYVDTTGKESASTDTIMYVVVASAGRNGTGVQLGKDGTNLNSDGTIATSSAAVNHSDGIDDLGVIIRLKNGTLMTSSFGSDSSVLGTLQGYQWIFGVCGASNGLYHDFLNNIGDIEVGNIKRAGSIDYYTDESVITEKDSAKVAKWVGSLTGGNGTDDATGTSTGGTTGDGT